MKNPWPSPQEERDNKSRPSRKVGHKRKSTKKWCKGVEGREHVPVLVQRSQYGGNLCRVQERWFWRERVTVWVCVHHWECEKCGKHLKAATECPDQKADPYKSVQELPFRHTW